MVFFHSYVSLPEGIAPPTTRHPGSMESLAQFTATAVDALAKDGFCVIQLPLSPGRPSEMGQKRWKLRFDTKNRVYIVTIYI